MMAFTSLVWDVHGWATKVVKILLRDLLLGGLCSVSGIRSVIAQ